MSSDVIALSRITYQKVMLNLVWGIALPMNISALAINLSTVIVTVKRTFYVISL